MLNGLERQASDLEIRVSNPGPGSDYPLENLVCKRREIYRLYLNYKVRLHLIINVLNLRFSYHTCD